MDADLDCVGIPMSKLGIRRKIVALHNLKDFYVLPKEKEEEEEEESEEQEGESEEEEEDESEEDV